MLQYHLANHGHDFLEDFSAFLHKQLVVARPALVNRPLSMCAVEESEIVPDIVRELRFQTRA